MNSSTRSNPRKGADDGRGAHRGGGRPDGLLEVGKVGRPHGVRGDIFIDLTTHVEERAKVGSQLWIGGQWREITTSARSNGRWRVHFDGLDVREIAGQLTGQLIYAEPATDDDALWVHHLIGASVVEIDGTPRGRCVAVIANPAADLLELESGALVPANFVTSIDDIGSNQDTGNQDTGQSGADSAATKQVTIDPPAGLFELFDS